MLVAQKLQSTNFLIGPSIDKHGIHLYLPVETRLLELS